ncbi:Hypothetical predicted protein [Cloeon dipterum]|uniref:C-type lectin domain-containing protein n=1 Tax=Cloeon dipterum TaxID=197152 RepID=A0A8S1DBM9_9INSE|nr:Hypothetical predicted protein [Cloeon dipterum]
MVVAKRLFIQVLFLLSLLVIVAEVWGATTRRRKTTTKTLKKRIRKSTTTTTAKPTTTGPKTESPNRYCRNYNRIKKNVLDTALHEDFIIGKRASTTELLDVRDRPFGTYNKKGFRLYFDSFDKVEYVRAVEACLYRKLQLLALDTPEEINDSYFGNRSLEYDLVHIYDKEPDMEFLWTSAVPCSKSDPLNKATNSCSSVTWCSNNVETRLNYSLNLDQLSRPYCMIYRRSTKQLAPMNCSFKALFLCESACSKPKCPSQNECRKDESLFEVIGGKTYLKKDHENRGVWELTNYGFFYYLGEKLVNWKENWMTCCSLGLKPLALTDWLMFHFDRPNSPLQGVVYWSAMTRAGCPLHFENCLHNASQSLSIDIICGIRKGGSCVAVSIRDPISKEVFGTSMAVKTTVCASKLLLGCQGTEKTFEIRNDASNCDLPECAGLPDCIMEDEFSVKQPLRVLLAPWRFGKWHTCCDNSILELKDEYGTWDEAYKRCCSIGMDLLSVHNPAKQYCLGNPYNNWYTNQAGYLPFRTEAWTAGRDIEACRGQLRWCTGYLNDYLKNDLTWKKGHDPRFANNSCVYIDFGDPVGPSLALADCSIKKQIICEAPMGVSFKSAMHYYPCMRNFRVKESDAKKIWNTGDLSRTNYAAKRMIQCLAEHIGLVYNSTKINEHVYLQMMSRMFYPLNAIDSMENSIQDQIAWLSSFEALHEMNDETFAFDFLVCLLQSKEMDRFWKVYDFKFERASVIPADHELNSKCFAFYNFLKNTSLCIPPNYLHTLNDSGPLLTLGPINIKRFNTSSFTACLERRGSLPYAETKQEFEMIYFYIRSVAPTLTIIWDQGYYDKFYNKFMWCRSDFGPSSPIAQIPIPVAVNATTKQDFVMLVSLPGAKPNLHAVAATEQLKYQTDVFCRFQKYVVNECLANERAKKWEY